MPYITKKKFEEYYEKILKSFGELESLEPLPKVKYPDIKDFGSFMKGTSEMAEKIRIDKENKKIISRNKGLVEEIEHCKNSLRDLIKFKRDSTFGLVHYNKIHTSNWGDVNIKEFLRYINAGIAIHYLDYSSFDL